MTRLRAAVLLPALCAALTVLGAGPAQADGYRYWSFWEGGDGSRWAYATQGPATARPADGTVNGFRFAVSADSADAARPRRAPDFGTICAATPAQDGTKRVALVIDFGTAADAPEGETPPAARTACARVRPDATAAEALAEAAKPLRYNSDALLCAISGYPRTGCGEQVVAGESATGTGPADDATAPAAAGPADGGDGDGPSVGLVAGAAAVLALGAAAVWQARRRRP
ncbi:SCO2322 family protein [Streptomyces sp. SP18CS02]|uniref:SCO2322 family protein n=1 Tax=Streptomyces sp. SP18CS02 TaxID=3002531 RepID=UPI002E7973E3|nr:SCO2322 family protein [Streptomyces sp. SP18CS02]MEE1753271.1 SCO2322 family protein [Streptomyces sp. SP18CS02]